MQLLATTTWNSSDIIGTFLEYYRRLGVDRVLLMDFDSTDQTQEIARSFGDFVSLVPYPGIANLDSSNIMLALGQQRFGPDARCLFCDPDEFLVVPDGVGAGQLGLHSARGISIPRHNVTARVSDVLERPDELTPIGCLNLRIDRRAVRNVPQDMFLDELTPPWIYTAIPGKVSVRLGSATAIGAGDHGATFTNSEAIESAAPGTYLLHYPFRRYGEFQEKIRLSRIDFGTNAHLHLSRGWQHRRWHRIADEGRLKDEYLHQFVPDGAVQGLLEDGTLSVDDSVEKRWKGSKPGAGPAT
jgi:hypothetical protein